MLLDDSEEMGNQGRVGHYNRLTEQSSAFRAADIEGIAELRQILQTDIVLRTCQRICQTCSVDIKQQAVAAAHLMNGSQLRLAVD